MASIIPILLNNVGSTVQAGSSAIGSSSATGINVATGDGANFGTIGTNEYIPAVIVDTSTTPETVKEYVYITARSTDALTVVRQAEESSRYAASTTTIQAGYVIAAVSTVKTLGVRLLDGQGEFTGSSTATSYGLPHTHFTGSVTTDTQNAGYALLSPVFLPAPIEVLAALIHVTTAVASSNVQFVIYRADKTWNGGAAFYTSGNMSSATTGSKVLDLTSSPLTVPAGRWLFAAWPSHGVTLRKWLSTVRVTGWDNAQAGYPSLLRAQNFSTSAPVDPLTGTDAIGAGLSASFGNTALVRWRQAA